MFPPLIGVQVFGQHDRWACDFWTIKKFKISLNKIFTVMLKPGRTAMAFIYNSE
jgi:hypothetical protein